MSEQVQTAMSGTPHPTWARCGIGVALAGAAVLVGGVVSTAGGGPDRLWLVVGPLLLFTGEATRRLGPRVLRRGVAATAVVAAWWIALGDAASGATPAPAWLGPAGFGPGRSLALGLLVLGWILLELIAARDARRSRLDSLLVAAFAAARVWPFASRMDIDWLMGDEGTVLGVALGLLHGERLYADRFEFLWPGSFALTALVLALGARTLAAIQVATTAVLAGCAWLVHACARREVGWAGALVAVCLFLTTLSPDTVWWSPHWMSTATGLVAVWLLTREPPPGSPLTSFLAGAALGATMLVQQHKGAALIGCLGGVYLVLVVWPVWRAGEAPWRRLSSPLWMALGALGVLLPVLGWFIARGGWDHFVYATYTWLREGYAPANETRAELLPVDWRMGAWPLLRQLWQEANYTVAHLAPLGLPLAVLTLVLPASPERPRWRWWLLTAGCTGIFAAAALRFQYYRLVYVAPATCLLFAASVGRQWQALWLPRGVRLVAAGLGAALVVSMMVHVWAFSSAAIEAAPRIALPATALGPVTLTAGRKRHVGDVAAALRAIDRMPRDAQLYVYPVGGGFYLLTGRSNPTPYFVMLPGYNRPHQVERLIAVLDRERVRYVLWDHFYDRAWVKAVLPNMAPDSLERNALTDYLHDHYDPIVELDTITIYERRDAE